MPSHDALALDRDAAGPLVVGSPIERGEVDLEHEDRIEIADEPREVPRATAQERRLLPLVRHESFTLSTFQMWCSWTEPPLGSPVTGSPR
jgi:hypothetical protein